jgi:hypothetical protein
LILNETFNKHSVFYKGNKSGKYQEKIVKVIVRGVPAELSSAQGSSPTKP